MNLIAVNFLSKLGKVNLTKFDRSGKQSTWRVRNSSKAGSNKVVNYFNNFPLYSSKYLDFLCWKEAHNIIMLNEHRKISGTKGVNRIKELKNQMNSKRVHFDWNHLKNFYLR
jgi:hypothetical protein